MWILLDRDGVINLDNPNHIKTPEEFKFADGSLEAIKMLTQSGYNIIVVTNQPGISRKLFTHNDLTSIHKKMLRAVKEAGGEIAAILCCTHDDCDHCLCRKPKSGLIDLALKIFKFQTNDTYMVGDRLTDAEAAIQSKLKPILLKSSFIENNSDIPVYDNLIDFTRKLIKLRKS